MKGSPSVAAFTVLELTFTILFVFVAFWIAREFMYRMAPAARSNCITNLKQVGIGLRLYANDHDGKMPMRTPKEKKGSLEFTNNPAFAWKHWRAASYDLANPHVLVCPSIEPPARKPNSFSAITNNEPITYFIGIHADEKNPYSILAGDADLYLGGAALPKALGFPLSTNYSWGKRHGGKGGNIVLADGSALGTSSSNFVLSVQREYKGWQALQAQK